MKVGLSMEGIKGRYLLPKLDNVIVEVISNIARN
jgi:hypothetical protein